MGMKKRGLIFSWLFLLGIAAAGQDQKVLVAVAANAQYALKEIASRYEEETGIQIDLIIGSSGKLTAQIKAAAPFDVFLSADMDYPSALYRAGLSTSAPRIYAYGEIVLWTTKDLNLSDAQVLLLPEVKKIAIANPRLAPYGEAAVSVLKHYGLYEQVTPKLVYGESISQVSQYIASGVADIGFTAKPVVLNPAMKGRGKWTDAGKDAYAPIAQGAILLKSSRQRNKAGAERFYNYLYSAGAREVFQKYGYQFQK